MYKNMHPKDPECKLSYCSNDVVQCVMSLADNG